MAERSTAQPPSRSVDSAAAAGRRSAAELVRHPQRLPGPCWPIGQIANRSVFQRCAAAAVVLAIAAGDGHVEGREVEAPMGPIGRAAAGFSIGGVAPVGLLHPPVCGVDRSLSCFDAIRPTAGPAHAVFALRPGDLPALTNRALVANVLQEAAQPTPAAAIASSSATEPPSQ